ncbi:MAG: hypothetical protein ACQ9MH_13840 [Nitrospinales bacterium]
MKNYKGIFILAITILFTFITVGISGAGENKEKKCHKKVQGKVAWNKEGNKKWQEKNVAALCSGTVKPKKTIKCFKKEIADHNNWSKAIEQCSTTRKKERRCFDMVQGKVAWNKAGSKQWQEKNINDLCLGTTGPKRTVNCFKKEIASHNNWRKAIDTCNG